MIKAKDCVISVEALEEHVPIAGQFATGDDKADKRQEESIKRQLERGNIWAWCTVRVTLTWETLTEVDYLGCCNYRSEKDFIKNSGYYQDMVNECLARINTRAQNIADKMKEGNNGQTC